MMFCRTWSKYSSQFVNPLLFVGIVVMIYALYKFCLVPNVEINTDSVRMTDSNFGDQRPPPPYGFHQEYMSGSGKLSCQLLHCILSSLVHCN